MPRQDRRHRSDRFERTGFELADPEGALHRTAHRVPFCLLDARRDAAVGDDFDFAIDQLHVDEDAAVAFRIPDTELAEYLLGATPGRETQMGEVQRAFDGEANLAAVRALG